ncbi:winged helix-turn-helix domain-containing protein [Lachnospiraceae bacterium 29-91]
MSKILILTVSENEEHVLLDIQKYLKSKAAYVKTRSGPEMTLSFPTLEIDLYHREIRQNERIVKLTDIEFRILLYLAEQPGRVFTYQQIYEAVWEEEYTLEKGTIMSHIRHIREKIEPDSKNPRYIENVRGVGYRFMKQ